MNRRNAIRNVILISAGTGLLPSCVQADKRIIKLENISISGKQEEMLATLTETILPKTNNFIGAKDLASHSFVLTMVDDCTSPLDQKKFTEGLQQFEEYCRTESNKSFTKCTPEERIDLLEAMEKKQGVPADALKFYETVKRYTVQSFTSSKEYMTTVRNYKMVPGNKFSGCITVTQAV